MIKLVGFCVALLSSVLSVSAEEMPPVEGTFTFSNKGDVWHAEYVFDEPVDEVIFHVQEWAYQREAWRLLDDDLELLSYDEEPYTVPYIQSKSGKAITSFILEVTPYYELPEKAYYAFSAFTGGGVSIFSGYYMISAKVGEGYYSRPVNLRAKYVPQDGHRVLTREHDKVGQQFVYMGPEDGINDGYATYVIDTAMSDFLRDNVRETMPKVSRKLNEVFAYEPKNMYQVFMAGIDMNLGDGASWKGGTQQGQLLFTFKGRGVERYFRAEQHVFLFFIAHEVVHLWQNDLWPKLGYRHPWMHEGMADAMALDVIREADALTQETYNALKADHHKSCEEHLLEMAVDDAERLGKWDIAYKCGAVVHWMLGETVEKYGHTGGMFDIWRAMARQPEAERQRVGKELLYSVLQNMGLKTKELMALDTFLSGQDKSLDVLRQNLGLIH